MDPVAVEGGEGNRPAVEHDGGDGRSRDVDKGLCARSNASESDGGIGQETVLLGQIQGDLVMGLFVPGLAGKKAYRRKSVEGALGLLNAVGYGHPGDNWLEVGIGIASGEEFVGNVGGGGYIDFTALGDVTNTAARLSSVAAAGETLVDAATYHDVADLYPDAERRELELKGKSEPVVAYAISFS